MYFKATRFTTVHPDAQHRTGHMQSNAKQEPA